MLLEAASIRAALGDHDPAADNRGNPPEWLDDPRGEATPTVGYREQAIDVHELGLELDEQDGSRRRVPRHDVDHASLPVVAERDLRLNLPARVNEGSDHRLGHPGVPRREDAIRPGASPSWLELQADLEDRGHAPQLSERHAFEDAALDLRIG